MNEQDLIARYQHSREWFLALIEAKARGVPERYLRRLLTESMNEIAELNAYAEKWVSKAMREALDTAISQAAKALGLKPKAFSAAFNRRNENAIAIIMRNVADDLLSVNYAVGRRIQDVIRKAGIQVVRQKLESNLTVRETQRLLLNELVINDQTGLGGVKDARGRVIPFDAYAATVARTTTREVSNTVNINAAESDLGDGVVKMTTHYPTCPICAPRQGRYYRTRDFPAEDDRSKLPHISITLPAWPKYKTVHPNCRHVLVPVAWSRVDKEAALRQAQEPFDLDPRREAEVEAYNKDQNAKRRLRDDRRQYQRYKAVLENDAPKTFAAFRKIKLHNTGSYTHLRQKYKEKIQTRPK